MTATYEFDQAGRLPRPGDNVAIATRRLEAGARIVRAGETFPLSHTVMEGHRFAVVPIAPGEPLLSWELPFGEAVRPIAPGDYICNAQMLQALGQREIDFALPKEENFADHLVRYRLDDAAFRPGTQVAPADVPRTFMGYRREGGRGVGTRNFIIVLATSSRTAGFARSLAERMKEEAEAFPNVDGVVAVTHTEGGGPTTPNNLDFILRTLGGFMVHPNVGAVLAVDLGTEAVTNRMLRDFMADNAYPLDPRMSAFLSLAGGFGQELHAAERTIRDWLVPVNAAARTEEPLANLSLALQCGGSDAFSGVSGNPLAGWVAKETIRHGGSANLAETDELIGAERYVLENVRDLETATAFLDKIEVFKERAGWHGQSVEGNPSGGNKFRGLYNIALKSIGAARKRDPEVRLDFVSDYAQRMGSPGYYFMDSPGNDLESIAGQVAWGANMILFITGNGSITNFPFVPTIKIMTTSGRYAMLEHDMDVNAGRYQDGTPMDDLGREAFEYTLEVASGRRSVGEAAGHSQVSVWRDWQQTDGAKLEQIRATARPSGEPLAVREGETMAISYAAVEGAGGPTVDQVGLIVPSSLCSGQIAAMIADKLNRAGPHTAVSRFVALVHTEGCGSAGGDSEQLYLRTIVGHLRHPFVRKGLLLEHGCEKTVNDYIRRFMEAEGVDGSQFGWASVQLDGGIDRVVEKVSAWFAAELPSGAAAPTQGGPGDLRLGLTAAGPVPVPVARAFAALARTVALEGGTVVLPRDSALLEAGPFVEEILGAPPAVPTLGYGQVAERPGLHVMDTPSGHGVEVLTGLGGTGVEVVVAHVTGAPLQGHPMIPLVQVTADGPTGARWGDDLDAVWTDEAAPAAELPRLLEAVASRQQVPRLVARGNTDFQVTRGRLGISM